jgi:ubiquinone/menaquinone biosynthesis C-methylase UbiE
MQTSDEAYFHYLLDRSPIQARARRPFFQSLAPLFRGTVLDVGCGLGEFSRYYPGGYCGIDSNRFCVEHLLAQGVDCQVAHAEQIPYPDKSMDGVLLSHVLEHLDQPHRVLAEIYRVLKPAGRLVIITPLAAGFKKDATHKIFYRPANLNPLLQAAGFTIQRNWHYPFGASLFGDLLYFYEFRTLALKGKHENGHSHRQL